PNIWQTPISSTPDSKPGRYSGRGGVASEQVRSGILARSWKQTNGKRVIVTGATTLASDSCLGRREGKEPSAINMLLISAVGNVESPF
ncbi:hypothetical protein QYY62_17850, partial [Xanthomonas campestris pv. campestris]|nr:hypothetical protein [Xanthomonas campestris pv. campestris]MEA0647125.1 hypothetical protein [Xanthomonas campestris pv. campestris]MEA0692145.1 hypothetical protein [Xanthomonas campestris pv. campestris]MEA0808501.1 hypothetical protein [Xanthomonas campestris pv. campestris]MEB1290096.1 hypothetical protein [Xanthomonas campestris pv. campestris]